MDKTAHLKAAVLAITEVAEDVRRQLGSEDDIRSMDDFDIVLRSLAATLSTLATASLLLPDEMVEMCVMLA
ncbi:MAG TPA: hypothetical protein ENN66_12140 [Proteobacteria bacterium]|nr:hypothetical protein [Pseudomonadota bacterium]